MVEEDGRHLAPTELVARQEPAVPGDDLQPAVNEARDVEAESADAPCQLPDLLGAVRPGICGIGSQRVDPQPDHRQVRAGFGCGSVAPGCHRRGMLSEGAIVVNMAIAILIATGVSLVLPSSTDSALCSVDLIPCSAV